MLAEAAWEKSECCSAGVWVFAGPSRQPGARGDPLELRKPRPKPGLTA